MPDTALVTVTSPKVLSSAPPTLIFRLKRAAPACDSHSGNGKGNGIIFSVDVCVRQRLGTAVQQHCAREIRGHNSKTVGKKRRLQSVKLVRRKISRSDVQFEPPPLVNAHVLVVICSKRVRDNLIQICATKISAGVDVGIGGRSGEEQGDEQFEIDDTRNVQEVYDAILEHGLQPVMSDYIYV